MTELSKSAPKILICDVGPRDGLQSEERIWSVAERVELIDRLAASGLRRMEAPGDGFAAHMACRHVSSK